MLILSFEEFNNKFNINNSAMSDIRIKDIGEDISLTPIEIVMKDETPDSIYEPNFNIIVNLDPTEGTHWVLVIRREVGPVYYFDSFDVETPPLFLEEYVDLGSNERKEQNDEFYCEVYCLYMIYLIDRAFRIKCSLNIFVNQCKYPGIYYECFRLGCDVNDNVNVDDNVIDNVNDNHNDNDKDNDSVKDNINDKDNVNVNVNDNDNDNVNDNDNINDNDNDNVNDNDNDIVNDNDKDSVNDNDNDKDNFIYLFDGKHQCGKRNNKECLSNIISVYINKDLQSWLNDDNIITEAAFPDNFRCIISGPSECGKKFLLKKLILAIHFDKLYIIYFDSIYAY